MLVRKCYVIFTATVRPSVPALPLAGDEQQREAEYVKALSASLIIARSKGISARFVLAENSEAEATQLQATCQNHGVQFVRCPGVAPSRSKGKGYLEALLLQKIVSEVSAKETNTCAFLKITGRLQLRNIDRIVQSVTNSTSDCLINLYARSQYADTRVMAFSRDFWQVVMQFVDDIDDERKRYFEHVVPVAMRTAALRGLKCDYLLPPPRVAGRSASTGQIYRPSLLRYLVQHTKLFIYRNIYRLNRE
jgi:hypothetical protein